jgi:ABC-type branched-subunit amino acid transport system ATPase component
MSWAKNQSVLLEERPPYAEYVMIQSLKAKNFRCFQDIELSDLRRVNIVVGKNAAGKTALLEVIRLAMGGTPAVLWSLNNQSRAFYQLFPQPPSREQFEAQWNVYFYNADTSNEISTECLDSDGHKATLRVYFDPQKAVTTVAPQQQPAQPQQAVPATTIIPVAFERTDFNGRTSTIYGSINQNGQLNLEAGAEIGLVTEFFAYNWVANFQQPAVWFSQLSLQKREQEVVNAVTSTYGTLIEQLTVLSPNGLPGVYATIPHLKEKLPLPLISAGINKFFTVMAAILTRTAGVVLIDEIENGLYYETLPALWKTVLKLSRQYNTQIFASTHSLECVRAVLGSIKGAEEEFCLLRTERIDGSSKVTQVKGEFVESAIEQGLELR